MATAAAVVGWRERIAASIARSRKVRGGNYVQLATVGPDGKPRNRTVVFRGFGLHGGGGGGGGATAASSAASSTMRMITDGRSEKVAQINASPWCEMVWWFGKSSEQYRIAGELRLVGAADGDAAALAARKQQWGNLSDSAREQFFWTSPGQPIEVELGPADGVPAGGRDADGRVLPPPDTFMLLLLEPTQVKYLRLTDNFAQADTVQPDGAWTAARVSP